MTRKFFSLLTAAAVATLAACGGGGDGSPTSAPAASTPPAGSSIVASVLASTYASGSEERAAFTLLNAERQRCGFGQLAQSVQLDAAAKAHANYQIVNNIVSHFENLSINPTGFTGADAAARVIAQGFIGAGAVADEIAAISGTSVKTGMGEGGIRSLLNAPYHLNGLMSGYRDVGVSVRSSADAGAGAAAVVLQLDAAYKASVGPQLMASSDVLTYPCDGTAGVDRQLSNETPNPVPGRDLRINPLGSTIYVAVLDGNTLAITSASMVKTSTGQFITLRTPITATNDPQGPCAAGCFKSHQGYVVADAALEANLSYQVSINGTNNGTSFSRTFTFTTGTGG
jgi:uncharacterized protein YkwD